MGINNNMQTKSMEKLSSGQRINRAGDDAAGLAISEKMRGQIRGLEGASRNAQDGVSLIQTAEGALNETQNILQRMRELTVQGANDTNVAEDREAITKELTALREEIDRISTDTEFNGQKLLNGTFTDKNLQIGANTNQNVSLNIGNMNSTSLGLDGSDEVLANDITVEMGNFTGEITLEVGTIEEGKLKINDETITILVGDTADVVTTKINEKFKDTGITAEKNADGSIKLSMTSDKAGEIKITNGGGVTGPAEDTKLTQKTAEEVKISIDLNGSKADLTFAAGSDLKAINTQLKETEGLENLTAAIDKDGKITITSSQESDKLVVGEKMVAVDVSNHENATKSISTLDNAIKSVSSQRADLGALQNRLDHTIATNDNSAENLQAAESRIRDVDMAKEMLSFSKANILSQASQAMLAQAKQAPQGVLQLLR
ncbi:MAG: flagellin [Clostridium sp.]